MLHGPTAVLADLNVRWLDEALLDKQGLVRVFPSADLQKIPADAMGLWCHKRAVYLLPSLELVSWLKTKIGARKAIEIGAGNGAVGRALGVPITDSRSQEWPDVVAYYALTRQPTIKYPADVEALPALEAVTKYRPQVVVACWVTQLFREDDGPTAQANMYGVDEEALLASGIETYIHIGATTSHSQKRILSRPHDEIRPDFLFGRAKSEDRVIWVWEAKKS